jgi:hypothetical protein
VLSKLTLRDRVTNPLRVSAAFLQGIFTAVACGGLHGRFSPGDGSSEISMAS